MQERAFQHFFGYVTAKHAVLYQQTSLNLTIPMGLPRVWGATPHRPPLARPLCIGFYASNRAI